LEGFAQEREEADKVAFAGTVGPSEDIEVPQGEVLQIPDGLECFQRDFVDWPTHSPYFRSLPAALPSP
jgi:hypothetical protein